MSEIEITKSYVVKLKNRRVHVGKHKDGVLILFKKYDTEAPFVSIKSDRNIHKTQLGLSFESAAALAHLINLIISPSDISKEAP